MSFLSAIKESSHVKTLNGEERSFYVSMKMFCNRLRKRFHENIMMSI